MNQLVFQEQSESKMNIDDLQILCGICDEKSAILVWDDRYARFRRQCSLCKYDWPES